LTDHRRDALLYSAQRNHLADQQVNDISLQAIAVLQWAMQVSWEGAFDASRTSGAIFYLSVDMLDDFLEDDVDLAASLMAVAGGVGKIFAADIAGIDGGDGDGFNGAAIVGGLFFFDLAFSLAAGAIKSRFIFIRLRRRFTGISTGLASVLFKEDSKD